VATRDTWSLALGARASRSGGSNSSGIDISEDNLFGTGTAIGFGRSNQVDRSSNEFQFSNDHAFGTWTSLSYSHATNSDGRSDAAAIVRPFYALDTRWAAGVTASKYDRIDSIYNAGEVVSQYRHRQSLAEVFGGGSAGWVDGWVQRYSLGVSFKDDAYLPEPGLVAPGQLPTDQKLVGPFVRYELIEDRFDKQLNRNLIGRPEFFALGLASTVQLGWAATGLGSSQDALLYSGSVSRGFEPGAEQTLMTSTYISGQFTHGTVQRQQMGAAAQYYRPQGKAWLFYVSAAGDVLTHPDVNEALLLGGDNGLRGYPLRYQSGTRRALFTLEERHYTDIYLWRLFRIGGAGFFDSGRAWGGDNVNASNPGWLSDVGFGLRIESARSSFSNILHVDLAFPLNGTADIAKVQLLVKVKTSF
jgi:outer membrane protein assembly factor BamA